MKVSEQEFKDKLNNLHTRKQGISSEHQINYKDLIKRVHIGESVLDVGCGTCWLKSYLPKFVNYNALDIQDRYEHQGNNVIITKIEDFKPYVKYDTLFLFATLDGMQDLDKAFEVIRNITNENVVILTGVNIEPDIYHTHKITEEYLDSQMIGFNKSVKVQVHNKILFLEYTKL